MIFILTYTRLVGMRVAKPIFAAGVDVAGVASLIAALGAAVAMFLSHQSSKRTATNTETVSYVDNNLKTMQATLDWLQKDNDRLRKINEELRVQNLSFADELERVEKEMSLCTHRCLILENKMKRLGVEDE